jgi:hypothetical protein
VPEGEQPDDPALTGRELLGPGWEVEPELDLDGNRALRVVGEGRLQQRTGQGGAVVKRHDSNVVPASACRGQNVTR